MDIVAERFDAGVRLGETVEQDMVAVRIGPDMRMAAVAAPYLLHHPAPGTPHDLSDHSCINLRVPTRGGLYAWQFERGGRALNVRVAGQVIVNEIALARQAARDGAGIAYLPEEYVRGAIRAGRLTHVLRDWSPPFAGYHLYYPSRRQVSPAFRLVVDVWASLFAGMGGHDHSAHRSSSQLISAPMSCRSWGGDRRRSRLRFSSSDNQKTSDLLRGRLTSAASGV